MTVRPRRPNIRQPLQPGAREQLQSPTPEQPVDASGHVTEMPLTYEELLLYKQQAEAKFAEFGDFIEHVYRVLNRSFQVKTPDPLKQIQSKTPVADEAERLRDALRAHQAIVIAEAKDMVLAFDRSPPRLPRSR